MKPVRITDKELRRWPLPPLDRRLGKKSRGTLLVVGGSDTVPGAGALTALAGLRVGAGTVQIATTRAAHPIVGAVIPEACVIALPTTRSEIAMTARPRLARLAGKADAIVLGPGSRTAPLARLVDAHGVWIIDASAISACTPALLRRSTAILTPHVGEMATLTGESVEHVQAHAAAVAREVARAFGCIVALKGRVSFIASPDGDVYESTAGNHGLGTCGSGDVLAGAIGGLAARGADALQAAVWGVHLHGRAGDALGRRIGPLGYRASEIIEELPRLPLLRAQV